MSNWITGKGIIEEKGIDAEQLFELVTKNGLQPYDPLYMPVLQPDINKKKKELEECQKELNYLKEMLPFCNLDVPGQDQKLRKMANEGKIQDFPTFVETKLDAIFDFTQENLPEREKEIKTREKTIDVLTKEISAAENKSWMDYQPDSEEDKKNVIIYLINSLFKSDEINKILEPHKGKSRPNQLAKTKSRRITKDLLKKYPKMGIKEMADRPEIKRVAGNWTHQTRHRWICDLFSDEARKLTRKRSKKTKN